MKTLVLIRHAKSDWDHPDLSDKERPLNARGLHDAPMMAKIIAGMGNRPDLIISSPAVRALTTAKFFAEAFHIHVNEILVKDTIYESGGSAIIYMLNEIDDKYNTVYLVGHNPIITGLAHHFTDSNISSMPTCSVVAIEFNLGQWKDLGDSKGKMKFYEYPKKHKH